MPLPSVDDIHQLYHSIEVYVTSTVQSGVESVSNASPNLPHAREALGRLWDDVARHAPSGIADIRNHLPNLGAFEVTPPPPPPPAPVPARLLGSIVDWIDEHRWTTAAIGVSTVSVGLLAGYGSVQARRMARYQKLRAANASDRRQVVVVLGADHPLALPLILDLESQGYIVLASSESPERCDRLEAKCNGYVRALPLDPVDPDAVPTFLRSMATALSRRFPINIAGDPHVSPSTQPYLHSVISLLSLPSSSSSAIPPAPAPLEHLALDSAYLPYLQATHITPLHVIQSLLPLLRSSPSRARDSRSTRNLIICTPATDGRVGLPFASARAMSAVATLTAVDILRREVAVAATSDTGEGMKYVRVVNVDVGAVASSSGRDYEGREDADDTELVREWTPSEQRAYGHSFLAMAEEGRQRSAIRHGSKAEVFTRRMVEVVNGPKPRSYTVLGLGLWKVESWLRSDRIFVGAGARTYAYAANLPPFLLDALLNLPYILLSIRNALLPIQPYVRDPPIPRTRASKKGASLNTSRRLLEAAPESSLSGSDDQSSPVSGPLSEEDLSDIEPGTEADVESNSGPDTGREHTDSDVMASGTASMASSWVDVDA